jgi:hypothetical protein
LALHLTPPTRERLLEIHSDKNTEGVIRTEEDFELLGDMYREFKLRDSLESLLAAEMFNEDPVGRVHFIHIHHEDYPILDMDDTWEESEIHVGVDSGQAGFFDLNWFESTKAWDTHYEAMCGKTLETEFSFGALEHGALSQSGYGDGGYRLFTKFSDGNLMVAARIVFADLGEDEDEDEEADEQ